MKSAPAPDELQLTLERIHREYVDGPESRVAGLLEDAFRLVQRELAGDLPHIEQVRYTLTALDRAWRECVESDRIYAEAAIQWHKRTGRCHLGGPLDG